MAWEWLQTLGSYTLATYNGTVPTRQEYINPALCTAGNTPMHSTVAQSYSNYRFEIGSDYFVNYEFSSNHSNFVTTTFITGIGGLGTYLIESVDLGFAVDHTIHEAKAGVFIYYKSSAQASTWCSLMMAEGWGSQQVRQSLYTILTNYHEYNWQSVPSISGKNGILQSLVQIKEEALNDGEPVSEATVVSFDSLGNINIPSVIDEQMPVDPSDVTSVTATYLIPALENGTYEGIKLLVKKGSIPTSEEDADKVVNQSEPTSVLRIDSKSVGNLDEDSHYYFVVKLVDEIGTEATSDPKDIWTSHSEGWSFDYTGEIQTFVAPKTGIYQLETWGAQGGDATDGEIVARGGYGAYAVGEVFLTQGDTLYINVGGQNGYGGGGNGIVSVPKIVLDGQTVNLMTIDDFSIIPSDLADSVISGFNERSIWSTGDVYTDEVPDWVVSNGDLFIEVGTQMDYTNKTISIKGNNTILSLHCPDDRGVDTQSGMTVRIGNEIILSGLKHQKTGNATRKCYMGLVLDYTNAVGYILLYGKYYDPNRDVYSNVIWISGGKYNGKDIVFDAFVNSLP